MVAKKNGAPEAPAARGLVEISAEEAERLVREGRAVLVDVREPDEAARERIEGAVLLPLSRFDPEQVPNGDGRMAVLHCRSGMRSARAGQMLLNAGWGSVRHVKGGIVAWRAAALPVVVNKKMPISVPRQVQIIAGGLTLAGAVAGVLWDPWFLLLPGGMGAGLLFSGVTGTCPLATLLAKMPWNRIACSPDGGCCG